LFWPHFLLPDLGPQRLKFSITCGLCKHHTMLEVANLIAVVGGDTTAHEVRQRTRCNNCGVKGNNTYQIVHAGNSDIAMDGAGVRSAKDQYFT
jgi:hypothetical protein